MRKTLLITFAYGAIKSSAVICKRNLRVLVKRPKEVPKLSNSFRGKLLAYFIIASLKRNIDDIVKNLNELNLQ
jgi:hypothetical protein